MEAGSLKKIGTTTIKEFILTGEHFMKEFETICTQ